MSDIFQLLLGAVCGHPRNVGRKAEQNISIHVFKHMRLVILLTLGLRLQNSSIIKMLLMFFVTNHLGPTCKISQHNNSMNFSHECVGIFIVKAIILIPGHIK